jgi:uncharacterized OB-fold protein
VTETTEMQYGDALTVPFWAAAARHELVMQQCGACTRYQFYPRPFCLACYSDDVSWVPVSGEATVYSQTSVHLTDVPYTVAVVELAEGPRLTTQLIGAPVPLGAAVRLQWQDREGLPPLPVFSGD